MKTSILVIDNEKPIRSAMLIMLRHLCDDRFEFYEAEGVASGIQMMASCHPHIIFLDIELDDGTAFDFLNAVDYADVHVIFTTAHNQYAIRAFEYSAMHYLMKPISPSALKKCIDSAVEKINQTERNRQIQIMLDTIQSKSNAEQKIVLRDLNGTYFVTIGDIIYCEASGPYTTFYFENKPSITISKHLKEFEKLLRDYQFVRCHHSYLVNLKKVVAINRKQHNLICAEGGYQIPVSTRKKDDVFRLLDASNT